MTEPLPKLLEKIDAAHLPSLPHILLLALEACNSEEPSFAELANIVKKDTALTAKLLGIAYPDPHGRPNKILSLQNTLQELGIDTIRTTVINASVYQVFSQLGGIAGLDLKRFWWHSLLCATLAELIAQKTAYPAPEEAYLAGLLHDVGQLALWTNLPKDYAAVAESDHQETQLTVLEKAHIGATHCEIGASLIDRWQMQSFMADSVLYHHDAVERVADAHPLVKIIHLANHLSEQIAKEGGLSYEVAEALFGLSAEEVKKLVQQEAAEALLNLPAAEIEALVQQAQDQVRQAAHWIEIDTSGDESTQEAQAPGAPERKKSAKSAKPAGTDALKKRQLSKEVRDIALLDGMRQSLMALDDHDEILTTIEQCLHILFGFHSPFIFLHDHETGLLHGKSAGESDLINEISIPPDPEKSLPGKALAQKIPLHSFNQEEDAPALSILDEQLIRLAHKEGMLCIPLAAGNAIAGVVAVGIDKAQLPRLEKRYRLMSMFSRLAAQALDSSRSQQARTSAAHSENLALLKTQARKVMHELNNPLSIMKNYIKILMLKLEQEKDGEVLNDLNIINDEIDRVSGIVRTLSSWQETPVQAGEAVNINSVIADLLTFAAPLLKQNRVKAEIDLNDALPPIKTDRDKLKQVLLNLFKNSVEAMPQGGVLSVATRGNVNQNGIDYAEIVVRDSGPGMPAEVMAHLFEPVASTKGEGHAGLGLSIVKHIIGDLQGSIICTSEDKGVTFQLLLPKMFNT